MMSAMKRREFHPGCASTRARGSRIALSAKIFNLLQKLEPLLVRDV